jgi:hypothetical protein
MSKLYDLYVEDGIDKDSLKDKINVWQAEAEGIDSKIRIYEQIKFSTAGVERIKNICVLKGNALKTQIKKLCNK